MISLQGPGLQNRYKAAKQSVVDSLYKLLDDLRDKLMMQVKAKKARKQKNKEVGALEEQIDRLGSEVEQVRHDIKRRKGEIRDIEDNYKMSMQNLEANFQKLTQKNSQQRNDLAAIDPNKNKELCALPAGVSGSKFEEKEEEGEPDASTTTEEEKTRNEVQERAAPKDHVVASGAERAPVVPFVVVSGMPMREGPLADYAQSAARPQLPGAAAPGGVVPADFPQPVAPPPPGVASAAPPAGYAQQQAAAYAPPPPGVASAAPPAGYAQQQAAAYAPPPPGVASAAPTQPGVVAPPPPLTPEEQEEQEEDAHMTRSAPAIVRPPKPKAVPLAVQQEAATEKEQEEKAEEPKKEAEKAEEQEKKDDKMVEELKEESEPEGKKDEKMKKKKAEEQEKKDGKMVEELKEEKEPEEKKEDKEPEEKKEKKEDKKPEEKKDDKKPEEKKEGEKEGTKEPKKDSTEAAKGQGKGYVESEDDVKKKEDLIRKMTPKPGTPSKGSEVFRAGHRVLYDPAQDPMNELKVSVKVRNANRDPHVKFEPQPWSSFVEKKSASTSSELQKRGPDSSSELQKKHNKKLNHYEKTLLGERLIQEDEKTHRDGIVVATIQQANPGRDKGEVKRVRKVPHILQPHTYGTHDDHNKRCAPMRMGRTMRNSFYIQRRL